MEVINNAVKCIDCANRDLHHDTPYDHRLLTPLKRPPQALVNPANVELLLKKEFADVMEGLMAPQQYLGIKKVLQKSQDLSKQFLTTIGELIEKRDAAAASIQKPLPSLAVCKKLPEVLSAARNAEANYKKEDALITVKTLIQCLEKINGHLSNNLELASNIIQLKSKRMEKETSSIVFKDIINLLNMKLEMQTDTLKSLKDKKEYHIEKFMPEGWNLDQLAPIIHLIEVKKDELSKIASKEELIAKDISTETEQAVTTNKDVERECQINIQLLKNLPSDNWITGYGIAYQKAISERTEYIIKRETSVKNLVSQLEESIAKMSSIVEKAEKQSTRVEEYQKQADDLQDFVKGIEVCTAFRHDLYKQIQHFLNTREVSARIVANNLAFDHEALYGREKRDGLIAKLGDVPYTWADFDLDSMDQNVVDSIKAENLVSILFEKLILPVTESRPINSKRREAPKLSAFKELVVPASINSKSAKLQFKPRTPGNADGGLWNKLQTQIPTAMFSDALFTFPLTEVQMNNPNAIPRRPSKAPARFESPDDSKLSKMESIKRIVSFSVDEKLHNDPSYVNKLFQNFKDGISKLIPPKAGDRKKYAARVSSRGEENPFVSLPNSRKSSYATAMEFSESINDVLEGGSNLDYATAVAKENARLRDMVLQVRRMEKKTNEEKMAALKNKVNGKELRIRDLEVNASEPIKYKRQSRQGTKTIQEWVDQQSKINPLEDSTSSSTLSDILGKEQQKETATFAAAVAMGVRAAQRVIFSERKHVPEYVDYSAKTILGHSSLSVQMRVEPDSYEFINTAKEEDFNRKDSGIETSYSFLDNHGSDYSNSKAVMIANMKNDNDLIAQKLLGAKSRNIKK